MHRNDDLVLVILPALPALVISASSTTAAVPVTTRSPVEGVAHTLPVPGAFDARNPTPVLRNWVREPLVRPAAAVVLLPVRGWCYVKVEGVGYSEETSQQRKERKEDRRRREGRGTHTTNTRDSRHGRSRWEDAIREGEVSILCSSKRRRSVEGRCEKRVGEDSPVRRPTDLTTEPLPSARVAIGTSVSTPVDAISVP
jgi:hypothetical protein